jgi:DNA-binding GntR family transcriptional regulator
MLLIVTPGGAAPSTQPLAFDRASLTDRVTAWALDAIRTGRMPPGSLQSVHRLAEELGVSRTPVREAMVRLAETGLVRPERNRGFRVVGADALEVAEVFQLRLLLEVPAARRAATRLRPGDLAALEQEMAAMHAAAADGDAEALSRHDRRFHQLIVAAAGNARLERTVRGLRDATVALGLSTAERSRTLADIVTEHEPLLDALRRGDGDAAAAAMSAHLTCTAELLLRQLGAAGGVVEALAWDEPGQRSAR